MARREAVGPGGSAVLLPQLARAMIEATENADRVVMFSSLERTRISSRDALRATFRKSLPSGFQ